MRAAVIAALFFGKPLDALHLFEDLERSLDDLFAGRRNARERPALTQKDRKAQLVFQLFELFAHARLRGMHALRGRGDIEVVVDDRC